MWDDLESNCVTLAHCEDVIKVVSQRHAAFSLTFYSLGTIHELLSFVQL